MTNEQSKGIICAHAFTSITQSAEGIKVGKRVPLPRARWTTIALLWCICFLNYSDRQAIFVLFPLLKGSLSLSVVQLGVIGSSFMWTYACFGPLAGWLGDRWSRRKLITAGLVLWIVIAILTGFARSFAALVILRGVSGLSEAFYFPAAMSLISSYHGAATRSRAMAVHQSAVYVGSIGGGTLAGFIGQRSGWQASFWFFAALGVMVLVFVLLYLREPETDASYERQSPAPTGVPGLSLWSSIRLFLSDRAVRVLALVFVGANFVAMVFTSWLPTYLHDRFHMSLSLAGLNATLFLQLASIVGVIVGGIVADRAAGRRMGGRMLVQALGLLCGAPFLFLAGWTFTVPVLLASMIGFGLCKGAYDSNIFASLYDLVPARNRAASAGLLNSLGWLGGGAAPLLIAFAVQHIPMRACLCATAAIYLVLAIVLLLNIRMVRMRREQTESMLLS